MSTLDQKLAKAAAVAAEMRRKKWNTDSAPVPATIAPEQPPAPTATSTVNKGVSKRVQNWIDVAVSDTVKAETVKLHRANVSHVTDIDRKVNSAVAKVNSRADELKDILDNMRPKQFVIGEAEPVVLGEIEGIQHYQYETLVKATNVKDRKGNRKNVILKGPAGSGKSTAGYNLAKMLGFEFYYIGQTLMPHQIEGYVRQGDGVFQSTFFTEAYQKPSVLMLEEMDGWSPQATLVANPPLANGYMALPNGEMIERHPDCIIIACANTWGNGATAEYVGRNKLDAAFLDRFAFKIEWKYDDQLERAAAGNDELVTMVQIARMNADKAGIKVLISPRASIDCADMVRQGFDVREAFELNFLSALDNQQRKVVLSGVDFG